MGRFVARRVGMLVLALVVSSFVVFISLDLAPGESKDIRLAYRMKWPADRDIVIGSALPVPLQAR